MRVVIAALVMVAGVAHAQGVRSCRSELGPRRSEALVHRCLMVTPATHPPCNVSNPCEMIRAEVVRGCRYIQDGPVPGVVPGWCKDELAR